MHELALADALVELTVRHAAGRPVARVEVSVGHLRQVVPDALAFAFGLCAQGTAADGAELVIAVVPAAVRCRACGATTEQDGFPLACGVCAGLQVDVVAGEELRLDALEVETARPDGRWGPASAGHVAGSGTPHDDELTTIGRTEP
jgi:hydrogenase nickel incorporation protein HypA/HybF